MKTMTVRTKVFAGTPEYITYGVRQDGNTGYVYRISPGGDHRQVCERLRGSGNTLMATCDTLETVIRRELAKARRDYHKDGGV